MFSGTRVVHAVAGPGIDPQLPNAFADRTAIPEQPPRQPVLSKLDRGIGDGIGHGVEPLLQRNTRVGSLVVQDFDFYCVGHSALSFITDMASSGLVSMGLLPDC